MGIILAIVNEVLMVLFLLSIFNILKHAVRLAQNFFSDEPTKYELSEKELVIAGLSASYIITCIIKGIGI